jgi:hypothetical protein
MEAEETGREWASATGTAWTETTAFSEMAPRISQITREKDARRIISVVAIVAGRKRAVNWRKEKVPFESGRVLDFLEKKPGRSGPCR